MKCSGLTKRARGGEEGPTSHPELGPATCKVLHSAGGQSRPRGTQSPGEGCNQSPTSTRSNDKREHSAIRGRTESGAGHLCLHTTDRFRPLVPTAGACPAESVAVILRRLNGFVFKNRRKKSALKLPHAGGDSSNVPEHRALKGRRHMVRWREPPFAVGGSLNGSGKARRSGAARMAFPST